MAIQDFTTGQVLTAAQMDNLQANDYNQTVSTKTANYTLVAADKGTRVVMNAAGATTITVNTSLFSAGDTLYLQNIGAGVTTVTAGTATVSSAGPLAIPQNGSGLLYFTSAGVSIFYPSAVTVAAPPASGLVCVKAETTFSAVSSITADNIFSSSYTNYLIQFIYTSSGYGATTLKLRASGSATSTNYNYLRLLYTNASVAASSFDSQTSFFFADGNNGFISNTTCDLFGPQLAQVTRLKVSNSFGNGSNAGGSIYVENFDGNQSDSTQFDGFELNIASGTLTGRYAVYGYSKTV
jgi:hypothetical protein